MIVQFALRVVEHKRHVGEDVIVVVGTSSCMQIVLYFFKILVHSSFPNCVGFDFDAGGSCESHPNCRTKKHQHTVEEFLSP